MILCPTGLNGTHLEQVKSRIEHLLNDLLQKLFEHAILIDTGLIDTQIVDKFHTNDAFNRICRQAAKLVVSILRRANTSFTVGEVLKNGILYLINRFHTSSIRERRMVMWVTCGEAELVSISPRFSFSFVTMFLNNSTL